MQLRFAHGDALEKAAVIRADDSCAARWEQFLVERGVSHHAYSWHWRSVLESVFGHAPYYLIAEGPDKSIVGVLPLVLVKSMLFGRALISLPYLNAGGIIADSPAAASALLDYVGELGKELDVDYCELRHAEPSEHYGPELPVRTHKMTMRLALEPKGEDLFSSFPPKLRAQVRRPSKSGIYAEVSGVNLSETASLNAFYQVFSEHMRDLGTPVYPKELFFSVARAFGPACKIITVWKERQPVAAGITLGQGKTTEIPWASALKRFSKQSPNMLLYWEAIKTACADGYTSFDFGRSSPDTGTFRFKEQWGAKPIQLHWYYRMFRGELPDVNPHNPKYTTLVSCWKRLPLAVANFLGPRLTRSLP